MSGGRNREDDARSYNEGAVGGQNSAQSNSVCNGIDDITQQANQLSFREPSPADSPTVNHPQSADHNVEGVIYLITCDICDAKYVGQTKLLKKRLAKHRFDIRREEKRNLLVQHFMQEGHTKECFTVTVLEVVGNDKRKLNEREKYWMETLFARHFSRGGLNMRAAPGWF